MAEKSVKRKGRPPTEVPKDRTEEICTWIAEGNTLREWCRQPGNPSWVTVYNWLKKDSDFASRFAYARDLGADAIAEEALHIADTQQVGVRTEESAQGVKTVTEDMLGHRKLQIETRLKLLAKWNPKKYGDKLALGGAEDLPPIQSKTDATVNPSEAYLSMLGKK